MSLWCKILRGIFRCQWHKASGWPVGCGPEGPWATQIDKAEVWWAERLDVCYLSAYHIYIYLSTVYMYIHYTHTERYIYIYVYVYTVTTQTCIWCGRITISVFSTTVSQHKPTSFGRSHMNQILPCWLHATVFVFERARNEFVCFEMPRPCFGRTH